MAELFRLFSLSGRPVEPPAGDHSLVVKRELSQGVGVEAFQGMPPPSDGARRGRFRKATRDVREHRKKTWKWRQAKTGRRSKTSTNGDAALSPQEDMQ